MLAFVARALYGVLHELVQEGVREVSVEGCTEGASRTSGGARGIQAVSGRGVRHHDQTSIALFSEASEPESLFPKKEARFGSGLKALRPGRTTQGGEPPCPLIHSMHQTNEYGLLTRTRCREFLWAKQGILQAVRDETLPKRQTAVMSLRNVSRWPNGSD